MNSFQDRLTAHIRSNYSAVPTAEEITFPPQGMSSKVFFIKLDGVEYAVKYGEGSTKDVPAIKLIKNKQINFPTPEILTHFVFEEVPVLILKRIDNALLDSVERAELGSYVPSMVTVMQELHKIVSDVPYILSDATELKSWKDYILSIFDGRTIDWTEVVGRKNLDQKLVTDSIKKFLLKVADLDLELPKYSLLHTDFNQRNLFVDTAQKSICGIIDWEDAVFGDPLYDFARIRMFLWHFDLDEKVVDDYYSQVNFSDSERKKEELYWLSRVIQYLAWYSEEDNSFNSKRIAQHQDFLRNFKW